jgi:predicted metalloprotease with PDZ domain
MKARGWILALAAAAVVTLARTADGQEGEVRKGWLGFSWEMTEDRAVAVDVTSVYPGSPAARAGVRNGDRIVRWNGSADVAAVLETLRLEPGDTVRLRIRRDEQRQRDRDVMVVAAPRPAALALKQSAPVQVFGVPRGDWERWQEELRASQEEIEQMFGDGRMRAFRVDSLGEAMSRVWGERFRIDSLAFHADSLHKGIELMLRDSLGPQLRAMGEQLRFMVPEGTSRAVIALGSRSVAGAEFEEMNAGLASYFGTDEGALVLRVSAGTPAARAGLQPGDVVLEANEREVDSVEDLRDAVARAQRTRGRAVQLEILRRGQRHELDLEWE